MASVRRVPRSPFWIAKFRDGDTITYRSTKQKSKSDALRIALEWESLAEKANQSELTQAIVVKFANKLLDRVGQETVGKVSTKVFADDWLNRGLKAATTRKRYQSVVNGFLNFIGPRRASASVGSVTPDEIEKFRDHELAKGKSASTAVFAVKVLGAMFESARKKNQRLDNPAEGVEQIPSVQQARLPFNDEQILMLLSSANSEWRGMILLGAFGGLRLNDAANLRWDQIDLDSESLTFIPAKTALRKPQPISVALHHKTIEYLKSLKRPKGGSTAVFPTLAGRKSGSAGGLSNMFSTLLIKTGLRKTQAPAGEGKKDTLGRKFNELGFHSTRHFFISKLANADVPPDVRKALAGHSPDSAHSKYVHLELSTQRRALEKIVLAKT